MTVQLVGTTTPESLVLKNVPAIVGQAEGERLSTDPSASAYRCLIGQVDDHLEVWDLGTKGGTFVNGVRVTKAAIRGSDRISFGGTEFSVRYDHGPQRYLHGVRS